MGMAKHMAPNNEKWDCHQFVNHTLIAWGRPHIPCRATQGLHLGSEWTSKACGKLIMWSVSRGWGGVPPFEKATVLFKGFCVLQGTETRYSGISRSCIGSLDEVGCSVRELIRGSWVGKWFVVKPFEILPNSPNVKGAHRSGLSLKVKKMLSCFPLKVYHFAFHISVYDLSVLVSGNGMK